MRESYRLECREYQEIISDAVDRRLKVSIRIGFERHASVCRSCRDDFEIDRSVKSFIQKRVLYQHVAPLVYRKILQQLALPSPFHFLRYLFPKR